MAVRIDGEGRRGCRGRWQLQAPPHLAVQAGIVQYTPLHVGSRRAPRVGETRGNNRHKESLGATAKHLEDGAMGMRPGCRGSRCTVPRQSLKRRWATTRLYGWYTLPQNATGRGSRRRGRHPHAATRRGVAKRYKKAQRDRGCGAIRLRSPNCPPRGRRQVHTSLPTDGQVQRPAALLSPSPRRRRPPPHQVRPAHQNHPSFSSHSR